MCTESDNIFFAQVPDLVSLEQMRFHTFHGRHVGEVRIVWFTLGISTTNETP